MVDASGRSIRWWCWERTPEPVSPADRAGITAFRSILAVWPARLLSYPVRPPRGRFVDLLVNLANKGVNMQHRLWVLGLALALLPGASASAEIISGIMGITGAEMG